jgi:uncharacterized membrane protein YeiH
MLGETALQTLLFVFEGVGVVAFALSGALAALMPEAGIASPLDNRIRLPPF